MQRFNREYLPKLLGLDKEYIREIARKARNIEVSEKEAELVNKYTTIDVLLSMLNPKKNNNFQDRIKQMKKGKVDDYKFFVALYEDNNNSLPIKVKNVLKYAPCGRAKIDALEYRISH